MEGIHACIGPPLGHGAFNDTQHLPGGQVRFYTYRFNREIGTHFLSPCVPGIFETSIVHSR